ncbi:MAG TPA: alpha/beta hydrolase [Micromonosporaceae bacterium]|nr:alpha/beta hydrolase [Micromonosporaceae bacterium]
MGTWTGTDGTRLAYRVTGHGPTLVCLAGGPMQSSAYLGDLGGLSAHRTLVLADPRGTGESAVPADPATYRCDRQVDDVEALRAHLGLDRLDLAAHSGGAAVALLYAARHPDRVGALVLSNPSPRVVGVDVTEQDRRGVAEQHRAEPWFPDGFAALERLWAGRAAGADLLAIAPFVYGRWDDATREYNAAQASARNADAAATFYSAGAFDPDEVRAALSLLEARVLIVAGERDLQLPPHRAAEYAGVFTRAAAEVAVLPGGGHFAWWDDPAWFARTVAAFLARSSS